MAEIRNPNQQSGGGKQQDSRSFLVFSLVFLVMLLALQYFRPKKTEPQPAQQKQQQSAAAPSTAATNGDTGANTATTDAGTSTASAASAAAVVSQGEQTITVENELYKIVFTNRGAQVKSWVLKKYKDDNGRPLDLVNPETAAKLGYPLSLYSYDAGMRQRLATALYVPSATGSITAPGELTFNYAQGGLVVKKAFRFDASYVVHVTASVTNNGSALPTMLTWPAGIGDDNSLASYATAQQFDISQNGKFEKTAPKKVSGGATLNGPIDYAGVSDQFFGAVFLPDQPEQATAVSLNNSWSVPRDAKQPKGASEPVQVLGVAVGALGTPVSARVFAGPKDISVLNSVKAMAPNGTETGPNIEPILHFGWIGFIAKPLFLMLRFTHDHIVPNWGWSILILTLVLNLAMLPTRITMMKSALKMQKIQPEMQQIKDKYKKYKATDPRRQEMNKEIMALQQREGVNMFGGCLPMLIQYPLLYGFYAMLRNVIEMRQAHWLWLHDLAAPDALHILPIFVIVTMFTTSYLSPSPGVDPAQQKMMAFMMPVMFGFMMWNFASGVALYWAAGNMITTAQQLIMNRTGMGKQMREIAAKRAAKKLGRGGQPVRSR